MNRLKTWIFALCVMTPMMADAVIPLSVKDKFRDAGCRVVSTQKVARTDLDLQSVYVAWCSGIEVYLLVVKCKGMSCHVMH